MTAAAGQPDPLGTYPEAWERQGEDSTATCDCHVHHLRDTLLGTVLVAPTATSDNPSTATVAKQAMSRFGYNTVASGSVVRSNNVDVRTGVQRS